MEEKNRKPEDIIFEIGSEEIPSVFFPDVLTDLETKLKAQLADKRLDYGSLCVYGTPCRLIISIKDIAPAQKELVQEVKGPAQRACYDENGKPTKALEGFSKGRGVKIKDIFVKDHNNTPFVFAKVRLKCEKTQNILPEIFQKLLSSIYFPKTMKWGEEKFRFARPIRWICALYGSKVIRLKVEDTTSGRFTFGHKFTSGRKLTIGNASEYFGMVETNGVIYSHQKRKELITEGLEKISAGLGCTYLKDEGLLNRVTFLVEKPVVLIGRFDAKYLALPPEVLINCLKVHQKYFPLFDQRTGKLSSTFCIVSNGANEKNSALIARGNEKVIRARLYDADFFYRSDSQGKFRDKLTELKSVLFIEGAGNMFQKTERIADMASLLSSKLAPGYEAASREAALLCKADLVTEMVFEFPDLQGVMGRYYSSNSGVSEEVSSAIEEHYKPSFKGDGVPSNMPGSMVALADKFDNLACCFNLGMIPTSGGDPYGLRRAVFGIMQIIEKNGFSLSLGWALDASLHLIAGQGFLKGDAPALKGQIMEFIKGRMESHLTEKGYAYDEVNGVLASSTDNYHTALEKIGAVNRFRMREDFLNISVSFKRVMNILDEKFETGADESLLKEEAEEKLYRDYLAVKERSLPFIAALKYFEALTELAALKPSVDYFFDKVLVNAKDPNLRKNRKILLSLIGNLFLEVFDFSKIIDK